MELSEPGQGEVPEDLTTRPGRWLWSGGFEAAEREDYFGVRMHHVDESGDADGAAVIVPVSISVAASGVVVVRFKSRASLPPYRVHNSCSSVDIHVRQDTAVRRLASSCMM